MTEKEALELFFSAKDKSKFDGFGLDLPSGRVEPPPARLSKPKAGSVVEAMIPMAEKSPKPPKTPLCRIAFGEWEGKPVRVVTNGVVLVVAETPEKEGKPLKVAKDPGGVKRLEEISDAGLYPNWKGAVPALYSEERKLTGEDIGAVLTAARRNRKIDDKNYRLFLKLRDAWYDPALLALGLKVLAGIENAAKDSRWPPDWAWRVSREDAFMRPLRVARKTIDGPMAFFILANARKSNDAGDAWFDFGPGTETIQIGND